MSIHAKHDSFEQEVRAYFDKNGFLTDEATYHAVMRVEVKQILSNLYDPTSLYIRGRADRVAVHPGNRVCCEWEAKTHNPGPRHDMVIELLPFLHHISKADLGVRCLYAYRDAEMGINAGFWTDDIPQVRTVYFTPRFDDAIRKLCERVIEKYMPSVEVYSISSTRGSNDPFLVIGYQTVIELPHWKDLITFFLHESKPASTNGYVPSPEMIALIERQKGQR